MKIIIISASSLTAWNEMKGTDKTYSELTDAEFIEISKTVDNCRCFDTIEELEAEFNADGPNAPVSYYDYIRFIKEPQTFFPITSIHRDDLEASGFNSSNVDNQTMSNIASRMSEVFVENYFWTTLNIIAEEMGIPRKPKTEKQDK